MTIEASPEPRLSFRQERDGSTRVDLMLADRSVSWLWIVPLTIRIGRAAVRMDGIGGVNTREDSRRRGHSRRVLEATVERMRQGDAALSMLYGIPHFYPKFGYTTAGPDHFISLTRVTEPAPLPAGWHVRPFAAADLPAVRDLYDQGTAGGVGSAVRSAEAGPWRRLAKPKNGEDRDCRVVIDPAARVRAYAWRAGWHWYTSSVQRDHPDALVIAEVMADGPESADAALAACRAWAAEETERRAEPVKQVILPLPPEGPVASAAMHQSARFATDYVPCGTSMARVVDVRRLLEAMKPETSNRLAAAGSTFSGSVEFRTEMGDAVLTVNRDGTLDVSPVCPETRTADPARSSTVRVHEKRSGILTISLPQATLARLALGAFPPEDLLARLDEPLEAAAQQLVRTLFPFRHPHMYLPDRY